MNKFKLMLAISPIAIISTSIVSISCKKVEQTKNPEKQVTIPENNPQNNTGSTGTTNTAQVTKKTKQPSKTQTIQSEPNLRSKDPKFAEIAEKQNQGLILVEGFKGNVLEILKTNKLFFAFSKKGIIYAPEKPKGKDGWAAAKLIFRLRDQGEFNYANQSMKQGDKKTNDLIDFKINENELTIYYKVTKYNGKNKPPYVSENVYTSVFKLEKNPNGIETHQDDFPVDQDPNNDQGSTSISNVEINPKHEKSSKIVAKSINEAKQVEYTNSNFYASLEGKSGQALIDELFKIQKAHRDKTGGYDQLHTTYRDSFVDKYYENDGSVLDIYTEIPNGNDKYNFEFGKYSDTGNREGSGMNREHLVAQSWFNRAAPMKNDAHHVWPSDKQVNALHSNFPFGEVKNGRTISSNGTKLGAGVEDGGQVVEPNDEFKGDIARAFLYFALTYKDKNIRHNQPAQRFFDQGNKINKNFLKTMLKWHYLDPISQFDLDRNNGIYKHQKNRNPFIDYPELVDVVFNGNTSYVFTNKGLAKTLIF
ncbi:endonuclease I [Mycoplasmopsis bovigenitalium]|uniref:endonuclease n=1 Tax=Mycoplasmopsis bovigenitalium TaxID=2112 RepID=UPI000909A1F5|nr:endonuclease [Mycoplasmopsis bovigenitalium]BAW18112.1 endonuclease I [Mycoplasmopsis bovigenitalium]